MFDVNLVTGFSVLIAGSALILWFTYQLAKKPH